MTITVSNKKVTQKSSKKIKIKQRILYKIQGKNYP